MAPTVRTSLQATVIPRSLMRATVLGDLLKNFGMPDDAIRICQQGYAEGLISGVTIKGVAHDGHTEDEATLLFDQLVNDTSLSIDLSGGRSMIEAISVKFAHAVSYSVNAMKRKGLRPHFFYHFTPRVNADANLFRTTCSRFGLTAGDGGPSYRPGYGPRQVFELRPSLDRGISYAHATAWRLR